MAVSRAIFAEDAPTVAIDRLRRDLAEKDEALRVALARLSELSPDGGGLFDRALSLWASTPDRASLERQIDVLEFEVKEARLRLQNCLMALGTLH